MNAKDVALVVQEVYNQGHVRAGEQKLQYEDFLQLVYMAKSEVLYRRYQDQQMLGLMAALNSMLTPYELPITIDKFKRKIAKIPTTVQVLELPGYAGVYSVLPFSDSGIMDCNPVIRTEPGAEWLYCGEDNDIAYFVPYATEIVFYGLPDCITTVIANLVVNTEDSTVPFDIGYAVAKSIWQQVFRTITLPVDKRSDGNPNYPDDILREKLSSPQLNT